LKNIFELNFYVSSNQFIAYVATAFFLKNVSLTKFFYFLLFFCLAQIEHARWTKYMSLQDRWDNGELTTRVVRVGILSISLVLNFRNHVAQHSQTLPTHQYFLESWRNNVKEETFKVTAKLERTVLSCRAACGYSHDPGVGTFRFIPVIFGKLA